MANWRSLASFVGYGNTKTLGAQHTLSSAYNAVFLGNPSTDQQQIVLADLMSRSGWNQVSSSVSSEELWRREGMRSLFGVIFGHISLAPDDLFDLENAARIEAALTLGRTQEGSLR
jgi:hypothetical protein